MHDISMGLNQKEAKVAFKKFNFSGEDVCGKRANAFTRATEC